MSDATSADTLRTGSQPSRSAAGADGPEPSALTIALTLTAEQLHVIADRVAGRLRPAPTAQVSPWLDTKGAAEHLACGVDRVHDLVALGKLDPRRDGRRLLFKRSDLDAYVEASA
jgi:excisionase family DNA binding protein